MKNVTMHPDGNMNVVTLVPVLCTKYQNQKIVMSSGCWDRSLGEWKLAVLVKSQDHRRDEITMVGSYSNFQSNLHHLGSMNVRTNLCSSQLSIYWDIFMLKLKKKKAWKTTDYSLPKKSFFHPKHKNILMWLFSFVCCTNDIKHSDKSLQQHPKNLLT